MEERSCRLETQEQWDEFFKEGGLWEVNQGPAQTRIFAEAFCKFTRINLEAGQTLLDSSCALGDALPVLKRRFPQAQLHGCDFSPVAIRRAKDRFPDIASFFVATFEGLSASYDVILSSATLEHFGDYKDKTRSLLQCCRHLCILVPYREQRMGQDLDSTQDFDHVVTFREHSFDFLLDEGLAKKIHPPQTFYVPKAWSWTIQDRIIQSLKNVIRFILRKPLAKNRKMMLFEIEKVVEAELRRK